MTTDVTTSGRQLQAKDDEGLTLEQRNLLQELGMHAGDWKQACVNSQIPQKRCQRWLANNEAFLSAYNNLVGSSLDIVQDRMEDLAHRAGDMYEEAMEAVRYWSKDVTCPKCTHEFSVPVGGPDWNARLRAGDTLLKSAKILKDVKEISGSITHLSMEESLALAKAKHAMRNGLPLNLPPSLMAKIRPYLEEVTA